jgi:hypothetical protein
MWPRPSRKAGTGSVVPVPRFSLVDWMAMFVLPEYRKHWRWMRWLWSAASRRRFFSLGQNICVYSGIAMPHSDNVCRAIIE